MTFVLVLLAALSDNTNWPQFRGPNASGIAAESAAPPVEFGPSQPAAKQHLLWKQAVPAGHSSPSIWGERIFLGAFDAASKKLELLCLSRKTGAILWRRPAPAERFEHTHDFSNPATSTPAVDADRVYVYFGSFGFMAFTHEGELAWSLPLPTPRTVHGSATSPMLAGDFLILNHDAWAGGYLLAVDRRTGKEVWKHAYPEPGGRGASYATPVLWHDQLVLHRAGVVDAYDLATGKTRWSFETPTSGLSTPVASADTIFAQTWNLLGEDDQRPPIVDFATLLKKYDKDGDGAVSESEFPENFPSTLRPGAEKISGSQNYVPFRAVDRNRDGKIQKEEWDAYVAIATSMIKDHGMLALKPDGTTAKILWREATSIPEVPSPLLYKNRLFMLRNGGVLTCLDATTGKVLYRARTGATGAYFASPVEAGGHAYLISGDGVVTVIDAGKDRMEVLAKNDLGEEIVSSPAVAGRAIYIRTVRSVFAFGE